MPEPDHICLGVIIGAFGVKGEVRLKSFCAQAEAIADYGPLSDEGGGQSFALRLMRPVSGGLVAQISGVSTKEQADALRGMKLYAPRTVLPNLPDDEFYYADLVGLAAYDTGGVLMGTVHAVHDHGAGALLEITGAASAKPLLLPFTKAVVPTVDLATARIIIDVPEGAL